MAISLTKWISKISDRVNDTGWIDVVLPSGATVRQYKGTGDLPRYRRIGSVVTITGDLSPNSSYTGSTTRLLAFTLPEGYRPLGATSHLAQGSGVNLFAWNVDPHGTVSWERYRSGATYAATTNTAWLPINIQFLTDDPFPNVGGVARHLKDLIRTLFKKGVLA